MKNFKWFKDISTFDESIINNYNEERIQNILLKVDVQYLENPHNLYNDLLFFHKRMKIEKVEKPLANLHENEYVIQKNKFKAYILNH